MTKTHVSRQVSNASTVLEDLGGHAVALALVEATTGTATDYSGSILAAVLEKVEGVMHLDRSRLRLGVAVDHSNNTAHVDVMVGCERLKSRN